MSLQAEIDYFEKMSEEGRRFAREKPFSAERRGAYLVDLGQILSLIPPPPARLLDVGCGSGWTTDMFARSGYEALGLDIAPAAIRLAREAFGGGGARFAVGDYQNLAFAGEFDVAVVYDCLHHAEDPAAVAAGIFRALRPGGEVLVVEPGRGHHGSASACRARQAFGVTENDMPPSLTARLLRQAGFARIRVFPRAQFQLVEREGTGRVAGLLARFAGRRLAALAKTVKNTLCPGANGVVLAAR